MDKISQCRKIFEQAFGTDDAEFENLLFEKCNKYIKTLECDGKICSMLFALPCKVFLENESYDAVYIYAAATEEQFRGRGYMSALISKITEDSKKLVFLRPASESLISYYEKLGFCRVNAIKSEENFPKATPTAEFLSLVKQIGIKADNSSYTAMYHISSPIKLSGLNFVFTME